MAVLPLSPPMPTPDAPPVPGLLRRGMHAVIALVCAAAMALALGAVWLAVSLRIPSASWWFALPLGALMGAAVSTWVTRVRLAAMLLAAGGTLLAAVYMKCLLVGLQLAAVMGLPYLHTLRRAGADMLLALARASVDPRLVAACIVGMLLALIVAARVSAVNRRRASSTH